MENLSEDLKNLIYDYVYGNKKSWVKYYKKNVIKEYTEIIEGIILGITFLYDMMPSRIFNQEINI